MADESKAEDPPSEERASEPGWVASVPSPEMLAALREGVGKAVKTAGPDYGAALNGLKEAVRRVPPFDLLCFVSFYFLTTPVGTNPEFNRPAGIYQHHAELLQALALRNSIEDAKPEIPLQSGIGEITEKVVAVTNAFMILETAAISRTRTADEQERRRAVASLRTYSAFIRGNAYHSISEPVLKELFEPLDEWIGETLGVEPGRLITWWWAVSAEVDRRLNEEIGRRRDAVGIPVDENWAARIEEIFPRLPAEIDGELLSRLKSDSDQRQAFLWTAGDLNLSRVFGFTIEELVALYPGEVETAALSAVLNAWSLGFGDSADVPLDELLLDNPVSTRPIVCLSETLFLWTNAAGFHHSAVPMLEVLLKGDDTLWSEYLDRRGDYLEQAVARALTSALPGAKVMRNAYWTDPKDGRRYETDVLALVDSTVLIAECKGGRLSRHSPRGKARPLRADITKLLVEPSTQARRLTGVIQDGSGDLDVTGADGEEITIHTSKAKQVVAFGATLEPIAAMLPKLQDLAAAGLTTEEYEALSYNLTIFDLWVIIEILEHPAALIHYLSRRNQLEKDLFLSGEETDLLGFYLQTGFNLGEAEFSDEQRMRAFGLSDPIDLYFYGIESGVRVEKPRLGWTDWWTALLTKVEARALPRWTEIGVMLCNVAPEEQKEFGEAMHELRRAIEDGSRQPDDFVLFHNGPERRRDFFAGLIASEDGSAERSAQMEHTARQAMGEHDGIDRILVIGWSSQPSTAPYRVFGMFER